PSCTAGAGPPPLPLPCAPVSATISGGTAVRWIVARRGRGRFLSPPLSLPWPAVGPCPIFRVLPDPPVSATISGGSAVRWIVGRRGRGRLLSPPVSLPWPAVGPCPIFHGALPEAPGPPGEATSTLTLSSPPSPARCRVDESRLPAGGAPVRCKNCRTVFRAMRLSTPSMSTDMDEEMDDRPQYGLRASPPVAAPSKPKGRPAPAEATPPPRAAAKIERPVAK